MREAQFFYWKIVAAAAPSSAEPPEAFDYYLSAFLCAADSVTDVATFELKSGLLIAAWQKETLSDEDQKFLRSMQNSRKVEVHRTGIKVKKQAYQFPEGSFPNLGRLRLVPDRFLVVGDRQYGAMAACDRYLGLLADMLKYIDTKSKPTS